MSDIEKLLGKIDNIMETVMTMDSNEVIVEEAKGEGPCQLIVLKKKLEKRGFSERYGYVCKIVPKYSIEDGRISYELKVSIDERS